MNEDFEFRVVLLNIQNSLSDTDRRQLHFLFGEDIPRCLQEDGSLKSSLDALQKLFDKVKISSSNYEYLVRALDGIQRYDCAQRLRDYEKVVPRYIISPLLIERQQSQVTTNTASSSSSTMEVITAADVLADLDEDDAISLPKAEPTSIRFNPPDPDPIDCNTIDLQPFEDSSYEWTDDYLKSLRLEYQPRAYQLEIIRDVIRNNSAIVCLRTGSGKTFIAALLIKYYFIKKQKLNPGAKFSCLFFVPRKAIRLQQAKAISAIGNIKVQICEDDQTVDQLIDTSHVIVTTPQKFVNCLKKETVRLAQIDFMVFDECHNTSGGNPYCEIMKFYSCPSKGQNTTDKPKIIGLTATVSSKDAVEKKETVEKNLVSLCGKLACRTVSTVCDRNNIEEINQKISRPTNDQFEFVRKAEYNPAFHEYLELFKSLIRQIQRHLNSHEVLDGQEIGSSGYIGQVVILKQSFEQKGDTNNIIICDYLLLLTKKYAALSDLPFDMVIKNILDKINQYHQEYQQATPMDTILYEFCKTVLDDILEKHQEHPTTNSKLDHLVTLLRRHDPNVTKGLILVKTTFYAKTIYDYLSDRPELAGLVKPTWIVGQNSADHSLTIHDQQARLKQFCEDECNVLVATDIVQEGLDIPTCSYVIRYEFVSDEIGTIQSRGRARAQNSSYYLITEAESTNHRREQNNKIREDNMETAIAAWPTMDKDRFHRDVENITKSLVDNWEKDIKAETQQRAALQRIGKKNGGIHCRKCNRKLGELAWLKKRNTIFFINTPEFFNNNECKLDSIPKNFQENLIMGDVKCTCGNSLGGYQKFSDRSDLGALCALKCTQIKFKIEGQPNYIEFQQWSKNDRFDVDELEEI